jgi:hypothetical protein
VDLDGLHTQLLKVLNDLVSFSDTIAPLFNLFYVSTVTPTVWNTALIHLLIKDPAHPYADKTRPIYITNILHYNFSKDNAQKMEIGAWAILHNHRRIPILIGQ